MFWLLIICFEGQETFFYFLFHLQPEQIIGDPKYSKSLSKKAIFRYKFELLGCKERPDDYKTNNFQS